MDKVLAFLEKYVEWIAIAVGGLIFMFAVWVYWIAPDVTAEVGGRSYRPGAVDEAVLAGQGESLKSAIDNTRTPPIPEPPDLRAEFNAALSMQKYAPGPLVAFGSSATPPPITAPDGTLPSDFRVREAPVPPAASIVKLASGRSYADVLGAQQVAEPTDLAEVRVDFAIPAGDIADAFRRVSLPAAHQNTSVLRVKLMRQRKLPDGSWGEEKEVPLLDNNPLASQYPLPAEGAPMETKQAYAQFAEQNPQWVLQPPFYEVRAGDDPMNLQVVVDVAQAGEGAQPASGEDDAGASTQESQTNFNFQDPPEREEDQRGGAGQAAPPPQQNQPPQRQPGQPGGQEEQDQQAPAPLPPGTFNAAQLGGDISGWAWDIDAVPGETYRYRVVYSLKNPMFGTRGIAADPSLESLLVLPSEVPGDWSPPITVEPLMYFYMTESGPSHAVFTVFRWQNGAWQAEKFRVTPGDALGATMADGIDYRTGRTLVDMRSNQSSRESFALLVDEQGRFTRRTIGDLNDPKLKQLQQDLNAPPEEGGVAQRQ